MQLRYYETILPNLKLKTRPKQLLGFLPLDIALPDFTIIKRKVIFPILQILSQNELKVVLDRFLQAFLICARGAPCSGPNIKPDKKTCQGKILLQSLPLSPVKSKKFSKIFTSIDPIEASRIPKRNPLYWKWM
jgi:hypothetical protein